MDFNQLYSHNRTGKANRPTNSSEIRTKFQRDFDRIIFSSAFRRLQNKTQVFPLPGSVFVHNRLTHSLEVASVGRSLGTMVGGHIANLYKSDLTEDSTEFYKYGLTNVIAAACLCHDIGNPAFGHSGEDAIASYFTKNEGSLQSLFTAAEWADLINFEGNANAIRVLSQQQNGKTEGGLLLTHSTLSAIAKYPCESLGKNKQFLHRKKFGFFQSEAETFAAMAASTSMTQVSTDPVVFLRHPFVWLTEAADDICYTIIDLEDSHRLGIIEHTACIDLLVELIDSLQTDHMVNLKNSLHNIQDKNDQVAYLRAKSIHALTTRSVALYQENLEAYVSGSATVALFDAIKKATPALQQIVSFSHQHIYNHRSVLEIENAGYNVMYELLAHFVPPILKAADHRSNSEEKAIKLLPNQFIYEQGTVYQRVMGVLDFVSGMTDNYATELYRKIKGIEIGMRR